MDGGILASKNYLLSLCCCIAEKFKVSYAVNLR